MCEKCRKKYKENMEQNITEKNCKGIDKNLKNLPDLNIELNFGDDLEIKQYVEQFYYVPYRERRICKNLNSDGNVVITNFNYEEIKTYPDFIDLNKINPNTNTIPILNFIFKYTCYSRNLVANFLVAMNKKSRVRVKHYYNKYLVSRDIYSNINKIKKIIRNNDSYKNSENFVNVDCNIILNVSRLLTSLSLGYYLFTSQVEAENNARKFNGSDYKIIIPEYVKNIYQLKQFINYIRITGKFLKKLIEKRTIFNTVILSKINGVDFAYSNYDSFKTNDFNNYLINNNLTGNYTFNFNSGIKYFDQKLPTKI